MKPKYDQITINNMQIDYNNGMGYRQLTIKYGIAGATINSYIKNRILIGRTQKEGASLVSKREDIKLLRKNYWTPENRLKQSERKKKLYFEHPEKHPNRKLANNLKLTYPERLAYNYLKEANIDFKIQQRIDVYWADFVIDGKLVIEIDGKIWHSDIEYEKKRDEIITSNGYTIIHIPANNVIENLNKIFNRPDIILNYDKIKQDVIMIEREKKVYLCTCGKKKFKTSKNCKSCKKYEIKTTITPIKLHISKEELEILIKEKSMESIGRMFNVSGNAVKSRCIRLGIHHKKKWSVRPDLN